MEWYQSRQLLNNQSQQQSIFSTAKCTAGLPPCTHHQTYKQHSPDIRGCTWKYESRSNCASDSSRVATFQKRSGDGSTSSIGPCCHCRRSITSACLDLMSSFQSKFSLLRCPFDCSHRSFPQKPETVETASFARFVQLWTCHTASLATAFKKQFQDAVLPQHDTFLMVCCQLITDTLLHSCWQMLGQNSLLKFQITFPTHSHAST